MKKKYYQVEWENGNTDVFADIDDAATNYDPKKSDSDDQMYNYAVDVGYYTDNPTLESSGAIWSELALNRIK